ncbi:MAG: hypothetical protein JWP44_624 [Mucilaginibacter sp.]|nr:hypothetical protein [Mucilaginibacter sp.]
MAFFLRAKHWQLFLLSFGIPFILQLFLVFDVVTSITSHADPTFMLAYFKFFPILLVVFIGTLFGWFWAVGVGLQKMVPSVIKMKVTTFKVFFFIPLAYLLLIAIGMGMLFSNSFFGNITSSNNPAPFFIGFAVIFPLHIFSMFCIFYCLYFSARTIKTIELQRPVTFSDFAGEFFLIWFFFIGVWIIQPRINKMTSPEGDVNLVSDQID